MTRDTEPASVAKERGKLSPYQRIMRNAAKGRGVRLSAEETFAMSLDEAVAQCAVNDDEYDETGEHP